MTKRGDVNDVPALRWLPDERKVSYIPEPDQRSRIRRAVSGLKMRIST